MSQRLFRRDALRSFSVNVLLRTVADLRRSLPGAILAGSVLLGGEVGRAEQRLLAITNDSQPSGGSGVVSGIALPSLNSSGQVVLQAQLLEGVGDIGSHNDAAIWVIDGESKRLVAWKGALEQSGGFNFSTFAATSIADDGDVVIRGTLDGGKQGIWRAAAGNGPSTVALTASGSVPGPGLGNAEFDSLGFLLLHSPGDAIAITGRMKREGDITSSNSRGAWLNDGSVTTLVVRESMTPAPGLEGAKFTIPSIESVNSSGQMAMVGSLTVGLGDADAQNSLGLWRLTGDGGVLFARRNSGNVAGVLDASFIGFSDLRLNDAGAIVYGGELVVAGDVTANNNRGLWLFDGAQSRLIARTGSTAAAGVADAQFEMFGAPLLTGRGQALYTADLKVGAGGVASSNAKGIWIASEDNSALIARSGSGNVPGVSGASFAEFGSLATNVAGIAAFSATLASGGDVGAGNDQGLWLMDETGDGRLVARTGQEIAGRTIAALEFLGGSGGEDGRQRALNDRGQFAYKATFTNGDQAALLYTPELDWRIAGDGDWDDAENWTLGLAPTTIHDVAIRPDATTTVLGPVAGGSVRRLTLGGGSGAATLELPEGSVLTVAEGVHLASNGTLAGKGTIAGEVINGGWTSPGASTGILAIDGDYEQVAGGRLAIEIGGANNTNPQHKQYDQLLISGHAELGGALDVSLVNEFIPAIGDTFEILRAAAGMTAFDMLNLPTLPSDRAWATEISLQSLALKVVGTVAFSPADFNADGVVDGADLAEWTANFGGDGPGDADDNHVVDGADFLIWQREFNGGSAGEAPVGIPEPATALLLCSAIPLACQLRRSRAR